MLSALRYEWDENYGLLREYSTPLNKIIYLATGGWSDNEATIIQLRGLFPNTFKKCCVRESEGGAYFFIFDKEAIGDD